MIARTRNALLWTAAVAVGIGGIGLWRSATPATAQNSAVAPARVAWFDLGEVTSKLDEKATREDELRPKMEELQNRVQAIQEELRMKQEEVKVLGSGSSDELIRLLEEGAELKGKLQFNQQLAKGEWTVIRGKMMLEIYQKVVNKAAAIAKRDGYEYVFRHSNEFDFGNEPSESNVLQAIATHPLVYSDTQHDLSDAIVRELNADWAAGN